MEEARHALENQLEQSRKMEAVGRLAGGVAHDFNNLLTAILGYSDLVLEELEPGHPARADVEQMRRAGESAASLTRQLLAFSRKQILQPQVLDLNEVVTARRSAAAAPDRRAHRLVTALDPALDRVNADPGSSSRSSSIWRERPRRDAGRRHAHASRRPTSTLDDRLRPAARRLVAGAYVDAGGQRHRRRHGRGDARADLRAVLHDQAPWRGHRPRPLDGLRHRHAKRRIHLGDSEPGHGTTFTVYFPSAREAQRPAVAAPPTDGLGGRETILLAEDQPEVRAMASAVLRRNGYTVLEASHGEEALAIVRRGIEPIHLLLSDVVMPVMSGRELARLVRAERPKIRVLYASGYTDDAIVSHGVLDPGVALLQKPFTPSALLRKVREMLDAPGRHLIATGPATRPLLVVVLGMALAEQPRVEPRDDVAQAVDASPRRPRAGQLVAFLGKAHHDDRHLSQLERPEHRLATGGRRRAVILVAVDEHQRGRDAVDMVMGERREKSLPSRQGGPANHLGVKSVKSAEYHHAAQSAIDRCETAALNRVVRVSAQLVSRPPPLPPVTPIRVVSTYPRPTTSSSAAIRSR